MGFGAATLALAILVLIAWLAYVIGQARIRSRRREAAAPNLAPYITDEELEGKHLSGVLASALVATFVLAIILPVYYLSESSRQAEATDRFEEIAVERGEHWYEEFQCADCHGPVGGGGGAAYIEKRSQISTTWAAPAVDDVLYRYDEDEVRYWLVYGRQGSPMPAWGVDGGGPLNSQQIDELIAYLDHIQTPQPRGEKYVSSTGSLVERELRRIDTAADTVGGLIEAQRAEIASLQEAPARYQAIEGLPPALESVLAAAGTCTSESAALVGEPCDGEGRDADRDGLSDAAEAAIAMLIDEMLAAAPPSDARAALARIVSASVDDGPVFDPDNRFSTAIGGRPVDDLETIETVIAEFDTIARDLKLSVDNGERLMATAEAGLAYLEEALAAERWAIDFSQIADEGFDGDIDAARRAAGLYNAYCARCHTAGYSAGVAFTQEAGSGAFGPSLLDGRSVVQFPDFEDQLDFIIDGSDNGQGYGVNGIGRGWMPGFGSVLSEADLRLIVQFERALP